MTGISLHPSSPQSIFWIQTLVMCSVNTVNWARLNAAAKLTFVHDTGSHQFRCSGLYFSPKTSKAALQRKKIVCVYIPDGGKDTVLTISQALPDPESVFPYSYCVFCLETAAGKQNALGYTDQLPDSHVTNAMIFFLFTGQKDVKNVDVILWKYVWTCTWLAWVSTTQRFLKDGETFTLILLAKFHWDTVNPRKQTLLFGSGLVKINLSDMNTFDFLSSSSVAAVNLCVFSLLSGSFPEKISSLLQLNEILTAHLC